MRIYRFFISFCVVFNLNSQNLVEKNILSFSSEQVNTKSKISFLAIDIQSGAKIAELNSESAVTSASTTKLFSTATAYEILGKDKKSSTQIYCSGNLDKNGTLHGDIWIRGGGDMSLGSKFFSEEAKELDFLKAWVDSIKQKGIKKIEGQIIADGSAFGYKGVPDGWHEGDVGNYYGAWSGGLNFYDNTIKLYFQTGNVGSRTKILSVFPEVPGMVFSNSVVSAKINGDDSSIEGVPFSLNRKIKGKLPANKNPFVVKGSMPDPEYLLAYYFSKALVTGGINVQNKPTSVRLNSKLISSYEDGFKLLFEQKSRSVGEIAYWTNVKSVNLFAEGLLNWLGYFANGNGSTESGLTELQRYWNGKLKLDGMILKDGSGLSRMDAISAKHFCDLLIFMGNSVNSADFRATLPIAGKSGTIKYLCKGGAGEGRVFAKSGTLNNVKSYAGYVDSKTGKKIAFAFIVNDFNCSSAAITTKMEKVLNALAEY